MVWAGRQRGGLTRLRFRNGAIASQSYTEANGLAQNSVYAVYESRDGSVWAGTLNGGVSKFKDGHFTTYTTTNGLASNTVSSILETRDGAMWFATPSGLSSFSNGQWRTYTTVEGLPSPEVNCLFEDSSGTLWSGTSAGLAFFASNRFQVPHESPDVLREQILGMAEDKSGRFWIATSHHVLRVPRDKLLSGVVKAVDVHEYDQADGLESTEGVKRSRSVVSDSAGRIWFSLSSGLSVVNPSQINDNSVPALPHIEAITADNNTANLAGVVRIPPSPRRITFEYTGLSLAAPGRIRFRYFLEGFDSSWSRPVAAREAVYTNLGPGSYRFRLVASNSEGLWNGPETAITLNVAPAYYQTYWFRLSCIAIFIALLWALYRWRIHQLKGQEKRLRDVVETIPAMTFTTLSDGSTTFVNKRWTEYTGLSVEQSSGAGWQRAIHPEDLVRHSEKWRISVATGQAFEDEARFRRAADEGYRWFLVRGVPLRDEHGKIVRWYGTLTDIEDRKRAEEALGVLSRDLQESKAKLEEAQRITHVGYWEWNLLTDRVNWSDETYRIYGLRPQERPMDLATVREKIHPDDWGGVFRALEEALSGGARYNVECRVFRPTGEVRIIDSQGDVKRETSGRPTLMFGTVQDITDRKRAEQRLRESEAYLAEAQRLSQTGSWAWNPATGDIRYWSEMCYCVLGFDPAGPLPRFEEFFHRIHPDDQAATRERFEKAIRDNADFELDHRVVHPEKGIRDIHVVGHAVLDGSSNVGEFVGTVIDVTERKRAEEALQQSQFYLTEGQRLAHMGSWTFSPSGLFEYWSQELFKIHGLDPHKGAPTLEQYLATVHPQDRNFMADTIKRMQAERSGCDVKTRIVRPDGEQHYIRCVGIPVVEGEVLKGFLGTAIDITEQELLTRELELRQAHLTEAQKLTHTSSWAWRVDDRSAVHLSEEWYRIYGFDPDKGPPVWEKRLERVHPEDRLKWKGTLERAIVEKADYEVEFRILLPNGVVKWIHTVGHPVLSDTGDLDTFFGSSTDITERISAEEEREKRRQLEADLAHINRVSVLGEMAASLSHELKQPITATITNARTSLLWLKRDQPDLDEVREASERIVQDGNRAAEIIDRLRSLYKKAPPKRELVVVNEIIGEMVVLLRGEGNRYGVSIRTDLAADLPNISADRVQLQQVLMNLMLNGIEAMKETGGVLTVKSELDQDGRVLISVSDTGVGLPAEKADEIFNAFFTTKQEGSGMGLAISRSIIDSHGGRLWATTTDGRGATFHFSLPTAAQEMNAPALET